MQYLIKTLVNKIPELKKTYEEQVKSVKPFRHGYISEWRVLNTQNDIVLLNFIYSCGDPWGEHNHHSYVAVVNIEDEPKLIYNAHSGLHIVSGLLHTSTNHILLIGFKEFNDDEEIRSGQDSLTIINYKTKDFKLLYHYNFGVGNYASRYSVKFTVNKTRNWIALARNEIFEWDKNGKVKAFIYDLSDLKEIASFYLEGMKSLNSISLPGSGQFLIVTDNQRADHVFKIENMKFKKVKTNVKSFKWKVAISYSSKDHYFAENLAIGLKERGIAVFFDDFERSNLLGKDLYQYLNEVYSEQSEYCITILSENYLNSKWANHELKSIQKVLLENDKDYILPIRLDDTDIPGLLPQIGYLDMRKYKIKDVIEIIAEKITKK